MRSGSWFSFQQREDDEGIKTSGIEGEAEQAAVLHGRRVLDGVYKWLKGAGETHSLLSVVLLHRTVSMATNQNT